MRGAGSGDDGGEGRVVGSGGGPAGAAPVIVLGAGCAGYGVARELGRIGAHPLVLTLDDGRFYSKPALSEALRLGLTADALATRTAQQMSAQIRGSVETGVRVTRLLPGERVLCAGRRRYRYSALVLAMGAEPARLPLRESAAGVAYSVNDLQDYRMFRAGIAGRRSVAVVGAGLVGCEFANDLADAGYRVAVIDPAPRPLAGLLPARAGAALQAALSACGVQWFLGQGVSCVDAGTGGARLRLSDGRVVEADAVLSSIGLRPRVALAAEAGLAVGRGIHVDATMRTADPHIYALGDCAEVAGSLLPFIAPIGIGARVIAANLSGREGRVRYPAMPISLKTPACPTVICPPPADTQGRWTDESCAKSARRLLFRAADGGLRGFVLQGLALGEADALAAQIPAWLE